MADNSRRITDPCALAAVLALDVLLYIIFPLSIVVILCMYFAVPPPTIYIQDVYIPALDTSTSTGNGPAPFNASIFVDLRYQKSSAIFLQHLAESDLVVYYSQGNITAAGCRVRAFVMGKEMTVHKMAVMEARELPWGEAFRAVSGGSVVEMKVEMRKDGGAVLAAYLVVDATGHMAPEGLVELN